MTIQYPQKQISDLKEMVKLDACRLTDPSFPDSPVTVLWYRNIASFANLVADMIQFNLDHAPESTAPSHQ